MNSFRRSVFQAFDRKCFFKKSALPGLRACLPHQGGQEVQADPEQRSGTNKTPRVSQKSTKTITNSCTAMCISRFGNGIKMSPHSKHAFHISPPATNLPSGINKLSPPAEIIYKTNKLLWFSVKHRCFECAANLLCIQVASSNREFGLV